MVETLKNEVDVSKETEGETRKYGPEIGDGAFNNTINTINTINQETGDNQSPEGTQYTRENYNTIEQENKVNKEELAKLKKERDKLNTLKQNIEELYTMEFKEQLCALKFTEGIITMWKNKERGEPYYNKLMKYLTTDKEREYKYILKEEYQDTYDNLEGKEIKDRTDEENDIDSAKKVGTLLTHLSMLYNENKPIEGFTNFINTYEVKKGYIEKQIGETEKRIGNKDLVENEKKKTPAQLNDELKKLGDTMARNEKKRSLEDTIRNSGIDPEDLQQQLHNTNTKIAFLEETIKNTDAKLSKIKNHLS